MLVKERCAAGCERAEELGYGLCNRCSKAVDVERESEQERRMRLVIEEEGLIRTAESSRANIMERIEALPSHEKLLVMSYVGDEVKRRGISPLTRVGRAQTILLFAEALMLFSRNVDVESQS